MFIYKIEGSDGFYYIGSSPSFPNIRGKKALEQMNLVSKPYKVTLLGEVSDLEVPISEFNLAIDEINKTNKFRLKNGRFRVDSELKLFDINYIVVIHNRITDMYYIDKSVNVIDKLYRMINNNKCPIEFKNHLDKYGVDSFDFYIEGPYKSYELEGEALNEYDKIVNINNYEDKLYVKSRYMKLVNVGRYKS